MQKDENSTILKLAAPKQENSKSISLSSLDDFIEKKNYLKQCQQDTIPDVFIASTERTGATTFRKQLNLATSNLVDLLSQVQKDGEKSLTPHKLINAVYGSKDYAQPVKDNVIFINQLPDNSSKLSSLLEQYPKLLESFESIVGGKYSTNKELQFFSQKVQVSNQDQEKFLVLLDLYLLYGIGLDIMQKENSMLIVDEPELNLHPSNQRKFARFLADLVNYGVKVFITTHSDYIIKEFNTLIMLNNLNDEQFSIFNKKYKDYNREDKLDTSKIALYITREELIKLAEFSSRVKEKYLLKKLK